jgi:hypothetical protein
MIRHQAIRLALLASLTMAGASATTIGYSGVDPLRSFDIWFSATYNPGDQFLDGQTAGSTTTIDVNLTTGIANLLIDGLFTVDAVCVDFFTLISNGTYDVNLLGPSAITNGTRIAWMLQNTLPSINTQSDPVTRNQQAAAFQLAVWDIIHDNGDGFNAGRIQAATGPQATNAIVLFWASAFVGGTVGQSSNAGVVYQNVGGVGVSQQLMSGVPEPSSYALMITGTLILGLFRRRHLS